MSFVLDNSAKTNWKFTGIVVILAVLIGGGVLLYGLPEPEEEIPQITPPQKSEEADIEKIAYVDVTTEKGLDVDFYPPTRKLIGVKSDGSKIVFLDDIDQALPMSRYGIEKGITKEQDNLSQDAFI